MRKKIGQLFFIGISGHRLTTEEKKFIVDHNIGGVVLFSRNISTPQQVHALCSEIQSLHLQSPDKTPLFIAIDMEGGRVARLQEPFTLWPPLKHLGETDSPTLSFHFAHAMGLELRSVGINLDFAPCIDVFTNPRNTVIGDRSISSDPEIVAKHASALVRGYMKAGVVPCVKHFPGHGHTIVDSHDDLPVEDADLKRLQDVELKPFSRSFRSRAPMIMTAHISFPQVDAKWPVTLSEVFLKQLAREEMRYRGLIITDDLDMKALAKHFDRDEIPVRSLEAGADLLLYCNEPDSPPRALEKVQQAVQSGRISTARIEEIYSRVLATKKDLLSDTAAWPLDKMLQIIGSPEHQALSQAMRANRVPEGLIAPRE